VPIAGALFALFSIEQLVNGWKHGFEGPRTGRHAGRHMSPSASC
jgi:hypothetical protein